MRRRRAFIHAAFRASGRALRRAALASGAALSTACATTAGGREAPQALAVPAENACAPAAGIAELEREIARLKDENTTLIARLLGVGAPSPAAAFAGDRPPQPSAESGRFGIHLASYRDLEGAKNGWRFLLRENPDTLGRLEPRVREVIVPDKGRFLRLIGGGFASEDDAAQACSSLKNRGLSCAIVRFEGEEFVDGEPPVSAGAQRD